MSFWRKALTGLKIAGREAPEIMMAINPALGGIAGLVHKLILQAQAKHGLGNGPEKKKMVLTGVQEGLPFILPFIEQALKIDVDDEEFIEAVGELIDATVKLMNSLKQLPKSA